MAIGGTRIHSLFARTPCVQTAAVSVIRITRGYPGSWPPRARTAAAAIARGDRNHEAARVASSSRPSLDNYLRAAIR